MDQSLKQRIYVHMENWLNEAGNMIRKQMKETQVIQQKSHANDLVTEMDKEIERYFTRQIRTNYPSHQIMSEEGYGDAEIDSSGIVWFVDPIDGTLNYIHQKRNFAISIAVYYEGIGEIGMIYDVAADVLYSAQRGLGAFKNGQRLPTLVDDKQLYESMISLNHFWLLEGSMFDRSIIGGLIKDVRACRTFGSAALEFAYVAEGVIDVYLKKQLEPWDIAAGILLVNEVGGVTTNLFGKQINVFEKDSVLTGNKNLHEEIVQNYLLKAKK